MFLSYQAKLPFKLRAVWLFSVMLFTVIVLIFSAETLAVQYALLIEQNPASGGYVSPAPGVYSIAPEKQVNLVAVPKQGYRFLYWLGDVSEKTNNQSSIVIDSPKIVIAVFERMGYANIERAGIPLEKPISRLVASPHEQAHVPGSVEPIIPPPPSPPPPPPPIPEPSTLILLSGTAVLIFSIRKSSAHHI